MLTRAEIQALESVASSVKACFGPNGLRALVEGDDGRITLFHAGNQIFAQNLNYPLIRFVGQALGCYYSSTGDGSKKIILLLTALLREIHQAESATFQCRHSIELSKIFHFLQRDLVGCIFPRLITSKVCCSAVRCCDSRAKVRLHLEMILNSSLGSCCSYSIRKRLKEMLVELLSPPTLLSPSVLAIDHLRRLVSHYQHNLESHVVCVEGVSVSQSKLYPGFLLEGEFVEPALLASLGKSPRFKALLLHSDLSVPPGDAAVCVGSRSNLECIVGHYSDLLHSSMQTVEWMTENNVRLVLCAARLSPAAVKQLTQHKIAAVQLVDKDLLLTIAEYCGTLPSLHTVHLLEETADSDRRFLVNCTGCRHIHVGRKRLIHLEFSRSSACEGEHLQFSETSLSECVGHCCTEGLLSMLLCAPTLSYCRQLAKIVSNSLQVIGKWTQPVMVGGEVCLMSVCGGGAWEMALAQQLQEHINTNKIEKESVLWTTIKALQRGLLQIPLTLAVNASSETARKKNTTQLLCDFDHTHPAMISPVDGSPIEVREWESWLAAEPLTMQENVVLCALSLARQLCRIDGVIAVRRGILLNKLRQEKQNSDSENEE